MLLTPHESVKNFFKTRYGFDYDEEKRMFTTTASIFAAGFSSKKLLDEIEATKLNKVEFEEAKQTPEVDVDTNQENNNVEAIPEENENDHDNDEEGQSIPKLISKKIVVKAHHRKGK